MIGYYADGTIGFNWVCLADAAGNRSFRSYRWPYIAAAAADLFRALQSSYTSIRNECALLSLLVVIDDTYW